MLSNLYECVGVCLLVQSQLPNTTAANKNKLNKVVKRPGQLLIITLPCCFHVVLPGNFQLGEGGEVLKLFSEVEATCLQALMADPLRLFVPQYHGVITRAGLRYLRLEDLLTGLKNPVIMDCKMGVR